MRDHGIGSGVGAGWLHLAFERCTEFEREMRAWLKPCGHRGSGARGEFEW